MSPRRTEDLFPAVCRAAVCQVAHLQGCGQRPPFCSFACDALWASGLLALTSWAGHLVGKDLASWLLSP